MLGQSHAGFERPFFEVQIPLVVEEKIKEFVVGHKNIWQTIAVVIGYANPHPFSKSCPNSRLFGDVDEGSVSFIQEQLTWCFLIETRMAVLGPTVKFVIGFVSAVPEHVVDD